MIELVVHMAFHNIRNKVGLKLVDSVCSSNNQDVLLRNPLISNRVLLLVFPVSDFIPFVVNTNPLSLHICGR